ncbi:hypothetical protein Csa_017773 [Cucumis sativus]|nr:hypothetical protein Csa_017773 [Cucumis sativus]
MFERPRKDHVGHEEVETFYGTVGECLKHLGTYEKGTNEEIEEFIYELLGVSDDGVLGRSDLESVLIAIFNYVFPSTNNEPGLDSHKDVIQIFVRAATFLENDEQFTYENFKNWCSLLPSVRKFLGSF